MKIKIDVFDQELIASIDYVDAMKKEYVHGESEISKKLEKICKQESKSLTELLSDGTVNIAKKVWTKYTLVDNSRIVKKAATVEKTITTSGPTTVKKTSPTKSSVAKSEDKTITKSEDGAYAVEDEEEKKEKDPLSKYEKRRRRIKRLKIAAVAAAVILSGVAIHGCMKDALKNSNKSSKNNNDTRTEQSVDDTSIETTYDMSDEDVISNSYDDGSMYTVSGNDSMTVGYSDSTRYSDYGSNVDNDNMVNQLQTINDLCFSYQQCTLENLVVPNDYEVIRTINGMRNRVLAGTCTPEAFMNNVIDYVFENGMSFDGKVIRNYDSISPYAQYIVLTSSQSILQLCPGMEHTTNNYVYGFDTLVNSFDYMINEDYTLLSQADTRTY